MRAQDFETKHDTRVAIMRHAVDLFSYHGYSKTNIGDIAERVGMSSGNLYRYFKNKQAIGGAVVQDYMDSEEAAISAAMLNPDFDWEKRLRRLFEYGIDNLIRELRQKPKIVELADMICEGNSGILLKHIEWKQIMIGAQLNDGIRTGDLGISNGYDSAGVLLDATKAFWTPTALMQMDLDTVPKRVQVILDVMLKGMRAKENALRVVCHHD